MSTTEGTTTVPSNPLDNDDSTAEHNDTSRWMRLSSNVWSFIDRELDGVSPDDRPAWVAMALAQAATAAESALRSPGDVARPGEVSDQRRDERRAERKRWLVAEVFNWLALGGADDVVMADVPDVALGALDEFRDGDRDGARTKSHARFIHDAAGRIIEGAMAMRRAVSGPVDHLALIGAWRGIARDVRHCWRAAMDMTDADSVHVAASVEMES